MASTLNLPFDIYDFASVDNYMSDPEVSANPYLVRREYSDSPLAVHRYFNPVDNATDFFKVILYNSAIVGSPGLTEPGCIWATAAWLPTRTTLKYLKAITKVDWRFHRRPNVLEVSSNYKSMYIGVGDAIHIQQVAGPFGPMYNFVQVVQNVQLNSNNRNQLQLV